MMPAPDHNSISRKGSNTLRSDIHRDIGYILAKLEDIKDVVDECIRILDELSGEYGRGEKHGQ